MALPYRNRPHQGKAFPCLPGRYGSAREHDMESLQIQKLFDAVALLLSQFRLDIALLDRQRTIRHIRAVISSIIQEFIAHNPNDLRELRVEIERGLDRVRKESPITHPEHEEYMGYCLREVNLAFELADQIYTEYKTQPHVAFALIQDLPILRPFDYGTRGKPAADLPKGEVVGQ